MTDKNYSKSLEWESFDYPIIATRLTTVNQFYRIPKDSIISVWRDHKYKLRGKIEANATDKNAFEDSDPNAGSPGNIIKGELINGTDELGIKKYQFFNSYVTGTNFGLINQGENILNCSASINLDRVVESFTNEEPSKINEWFLTGKINSSFPRRTKRSREEIHTKLRESIDADPKKVIRKSQGSSLDFFLIETDQVKCIVQLAPKIFMPDWANGLSIEYRKEFGIPDDETRSAVVELVGFMIGTQLLKIGVTEYDDEDYVIKKSANDPWEDNVIAKCERPAIPPIQLPVRNKIEEVINGLLPNYLLLRKPLKLSDVIWKYWVSKNLAIGTNLPILSSALENLAEQYLNHFDFKIKYDESEKDNYKTTIEPELKSLEVKLKDFPLKDSVLNKLKYPFQLGITDKLKLFFQKLSFDFDNKSVESKALKSRNTMAHSSIEATDENIPELLKLTRAYETLFNRTLLKILDYKGKYIDYSSSGHSAREISENI